VKIPEDFVLTEAQIAEFLLAFGPASTPLDIEIPVMTDKDLEDEAFWINAGYERSFDT
jgi:hypothetical protein